MNFKRILELREQLGISQTELADTIGVSKQTMYKYENGIISNVPPDKIEAMATVLKTTPAYLMGWEDQPGTYDGYYENDETAQIAQEIHDNTELRALFSAAKDADPQTLKDIHDMLLIMKRREKGDTE